MVRVTRRPFSTIVCWEMLTPLIPPEEVKLMLLVMPELPIPENKEPSPPILQHTLKCVNQT